MEVSSVAKRRITKELKDLEKQPPLHCSIGPIGDDIFNWNAALMGPANTPYEGGVFFLSIKFTNEYPFVPPMISFKTKLFHPNISANGRICADFMRRDWSPASTIAKLMVFITALLCEPEMDHPYVPEAGDLYRSDPSKYEEVAREWTRKFAMVAK